MLVEEGKRIGIGVVKGLESRNRSRECKRKGIGVVKELESRNRSRERTRGKE